MQILGLLGMYFDAVVIEVEKNLLFNRMALAILIIDFFIIKESDLWEKYVDFEFWNESDFY